MIANLYLKGKTPVHKFDPRIKFVLLLFMTVSFFLTDSITVTGGFLIFILLLISLNGMKQVWRTIRSILPLLFFVALLTPPFHPSGEIILKFHSIILLSSDGITEALRLIIRFTGITSLFFLFFLTTEIDDLILSLVWFKVPFNATLVITIALRYIPHITHIYSNVTDAHKLRRGTDFEGSRSFRKRMKNLFPILVSVLIQSIRTIPSLAMALETKGFGFNARRQSFRDIKIFGSIILQLAAGFVIVLAVITVILL